MTSLLLPLVLLAAGVVILSGVWVTIALIDAVWHVERPASTPMAKASGPSCRHAR